VAGGTVAGFASSAFSCSLFNICKTKSTYISPIDYRSAIVYHRTEERERERERESVHVTLLLIKLWSAMTLRMREERYITNIISFVLTAQREEKN
jgi:ssRNA-specific RNase YbeY (16S rRNA maturation enzyme)